MMIFMKFSNILLITFIYYYFFTIKLSYQNETTLELNTIDNLIFNNNKEVYKRYNKYNSIYINNLTQQSNNNDIYIGFLAGYKRSKLILGAVQLAIDAVNRDPNLLPGHTLKFKAHDIGRASSSLRALPIKWMTEMRDNNVVAFIGPDETCTTEALVAAAWNLPMISYRCPDTAVSDKSIFPSFARTLAPAAKVSKSVVALLKAFHWNKFVIVVGVQSRWGIEVAHAIKNHAEQINLTVTDLREFSEYISMPRHISMMQKIIDETYKITRIYVFIGEHIALIDFIKCLETRKLLETGNYMVISVDDEIYDPTKRLNIIETEYLNYYLKFNADSNLNLDSFRSVFQLTLTHPTNPNFNELSNNIKKFSHKFPFYVPVPPPGPVNQKIQLMVSIYGALLYDAILIYARAATELLQNNGNIRDGKAIMDRIFNRSYHSIQGFDVHIDSNGDAEGNFTVIALQNEINESTGKMNKIMEPVGYFSYSSYSIIPEFKYIKSEKSIKWIQGSVPRAEPICGFHDELCQKSDWRYFLISIFVLGFSVVAAAFLIKYYRYEQKLACLMWKVDMKEVTLITTDTNEVNMRTKSLVQTCRHSLITEGDTTSKCAYTSIGLYRGNIVAVKRINKRSVDLTRTIRKELKQMREVHHENIIAFIGASVDHGTVAILTAYCARGSLEDVLANDDLHLDNMFVSSLVSDILKGLIYLHDSEIISHGNLRSSNCLVDSRWVCQISDFGLHEFKSGEHHDDHKHSHAMELKRCLWKAPELLRDLHAPPSDRGTQKGDVYSFGIVLYEIFGRNGPWGITEYTHEEIISKVRNPTPLRRYFRPPLQVLEIPDYVKQCLCNCWEEDPDDRPDIRLIRVKLKEMQSGLKPNIFDNMLAIMEKYAYNLEGLVQERTNQLYEEKKKTETLLLRMLPKTVAESLKRGERVEAESFECVTIFFSDLVGFTELCAQSTPFEVVEMLNDLYTCFDSIITNYDVYKVETIGDAYMVVSGLPVRNNNRHVGEIASLALHLLDRVRKLEIPHRPDELLQIRIGIHSGHCVAGVVGLKMPRYCLFGDTVNTASRMESSGEPLKIHISNTTYELLQQIGGFKCEERGLVLIKGKGEMRTYWLIGEDDKNVQERLFNEFNKNNDVTPDLISNASEPPLYDSKLLNQTMQIATATLSSPSKSPSTSVHHQHQQRQLQQQHQQQQPPEQSTSNALMQNSRSLRERARSSCITINTIGHSYQKLSWIDNNNNNSHDQNNEQIVDKWAMDNHQNTNLLPNDYCDYCTNCKSVMHNSSSSYHHQRQSIRSKSNRNQLTNNDICHNMYEIGGDINRIASVNGGVNHLSANCTCEYKLQAYLSDHNNHHNNKYAYGNSNGSNNYSRISRAPRSAPHITFMQ